MRRACSSIPLLSWTLQVRLRHLSLLGGSSTQKGGRNQPVHNNRTSSYGYPNSSSRGNTFNRGRAYFSRGNQYNRTSWQLPLVPSSLPYILGEGQVQCQLCDGYNPYLYFFNGVRIHSGTTLRQFIDRSNAMFSRVGQALASLEISHRSTLCDCVCFLDCSGFLANSLSPYIINK